MNYYYVTCFKPNTFYFGTKLLKFWDEAVSVYQTLDTLEKIPGTCLDFCTLPGYYPGPSRSFMLNEITNTRNRSRI